VATTTLLFIGAAATADAGLIAAVNPTAEEALIKSRRDIVSDISLSFFK
jgi:hypothetical protein